MATFEQLNALLQEAATRLDEAASLAVDLQFDPESNVRELGEILMRIFEIRMRIFALRPDLRPIELKNDCN